MRRRPPIETMSDPNDAPAQMEAARNKLSEIGDRLDSRYEDGSFYGDIAQSSHVWHPHASHTHWVGDDMGTRTAETGCRLMTWNAHGQCTQYAPNGGPMYFEAVMREIIKLSADIVVIHEAGANVARQAGVISGIADKASGGRYTAVAHSNPARGAEAEAVVIVMSERWNAVHTGTRAWGGTRHHEARVIQLTFKGAGCAQAAKGAEHHNPHPHLPHMSVFAVYGFADKSAPGRAASKSMWQTIREKVNKYRAQHRWASVVVMGDLNACRSAAIDTDRVDPESEREKDAETIEWMERQIGTRDIFRGAHPNTQAVTHIPQGGKALREARRRLDYIAATKEVADHPATRIGILANPSLRGDHWPVVADIPNDAAGLAENVCALWHPTTVDRIELLEGATEQDKHQYNERVATGWAEAQVAAEGMMTLDQMGEAIPQIIRTAGEGLISHTKSLKYPKAARTTTHRDGWGERLDTWARRITGAGHIVRRAQGRGDRDHIRKGLRKAAWPHTDIPAGMQVDKLQGLWELWEAGKRSEIVTRLRAQAKIIAAHEHAEREAEKRARIKEAVDKREEAFYDKTGKGKGRVVASVFRKMRERHDLKWIRREDGTLITDPEGVGRTTQQFFTEYFASRVPVEQRWGSWEAMASMDLTQVEPQYREMVEQCYARPMAANAHKASREGWWAGIDNLISTREVREAVDHSKAHTAPGPSMVSIDMIKALDDTGLEVLTQFYNACLREGRVPETLNKACMRLLPKTDRGLGDLNAVRPIALMENVVKIYEQVIVNRVLGRLIKFQVLDLSQYGAIPKGGVAAPLRMMAEMMDDARMSGQELHVLVADLAKAFDSMEYWSQHLSWKTVGLPEHIIQVLVDLDASATTSVMLGNGHKSPLFQHGRGVRQGSVGGPLKWVIFMNHWIQWVRTQTKGEGYHMSATAKSRTIPAMLQKREPTPPVEVGGMMFVDDSIWPSDSASAMQRKVTMHKTFCDFHGVIMHEKKSEYITVNGTGQQLRWEGTKRQPTDRVDTQHRVPTQDIPPRPPLDVQGDSATPDTSPQTPRAVQGDPATTTGETPQGAAATPAPRKNPAHSTTTEAQYSAGDIRRYTAPVKPPPGERHRAKVLQEKTEPSTKYLGVWFDVDWGWKRQRAVLGARLNQDLEHLAQSRISLDMAVQLVNMKVIPSVLYPLQVAVVPVSTLQAWDAKVRGAVRRAGGLPHCMPPEAFYMSREEGGLGLKSIQESADMQRVKLDLQARNDVAYTQGCCEKTLHSQVVQAAWQRYSENPDPQGQRIRTVCGAISEAQRRLGVAVFQTPETHHGHCARQQDATRVRAAPRRGPLKAYTDGSTAERGGETESGWGALILHATQARCDTAHAVTSMNGRLQGDQNNFTAESLALLESLLEVNPLDPITVYIDNHAVVQRWEKHSDRDHRGRSRGAARAVWTRIHGIKALREESGANAQMRWVRAHVDSHTCPDATTGGRKQAQPHPPAPKCACGAEKGQCDPHHEHHIGNETADELAAVGRGLPVQDPDIVLAGEDPHHLRINGQVVEGCITTALQSAAQARRLEQLGSSTHRKQRALRAMLSASDAGTRAAAMQTKGSLRFRVRALWGVLPTYAEEWKKVHQGNTYEQMYEEHIAGGKCPCCGVEETMQHIFSECAHTERARQEALDRVLSQFMPEHAGEWWTEMKWVGTRTARERSEGPLRLGQERKWEQDWEGWWGWMGLIPAALMKNTNRKERGMLNKIAKALAEEAKHIWAARNEAVQAWEKITGITQAKQEVRQRSWEKQPQKKRRARTPPPIESLPLHKQRPARRQRRRAQLVNEGMPLEQVKAMMRREFPRESSTVAKLRQYTGPRITPHLTQVAGVPVAAQFKHKVEPKPQGIRPVKRARIRLKHVAEETDMLEAYRDTTQVGKCSFRGCGALATTQGMFCKRGDPRCTEHAEIACRGPHGRIECDCQVTVRGESATAQRAPSGGCYAVDIGDTVVMRDAEEGTLTGEVTSMLWSGTGGWREPDAMEVREPTGMLREVPMGAKWRVLHTHTPESEAAQEARAVMRAMRGQQQDEESAQALHRWCRAAGHSCDPPNRPDLTPVNTCLTGNKQISAHLKAAPGHKTTNASPPPQTPRPQHGDDDDGEAGAGGTEEACRGEAIIQTSDPRHHCHDTPKGHPRREELERGALRRVAGEEESRGEAAAACDTPAGGAEHSSQRGGAEGEGRRGEAESECDEQCEKMGEGTHCRSSAEGKSSDAPTDGDEPEEGRWVDRGAGRTGPVRGCRGDAGGRHEKEGGRGRTRRQSAGSCGLDGAAAVGAPAGRTRAGEQGQAEVRTAHRGASDCHRTGEWLGGSHRRAEEDMAEGGDHGQTATAEQRTRPAPRDPGRVRGRGGAPCGAGGVGSCALRCLTGGAGCSVGICGLHSGVDRAGHEQGQGPCSRGVRDRETHTRGAASTRGSFQGDREGQGEVPEAPVLHRKRRLRSPAEREVDHEEVREGHRRPRMCIRPKEWQDIQAVALTGDGSPIHRRRPEEPRVVLRALQKAAAAEPRRARAGRDPQERRQAQAHQQRGRVQQGSTKHGANGAGGARGQADEGGVGRSLRWLEQLRRERKRWGCPVGEQDRPPKRHRSGPSVRDGADSDADSDADFGRFSTEKGADEQAPPGQPGGRAARTRKRKPGGTGQTQRKRAKRSQPTRTCNIVHECYIDIITCGAPPQGVSDRSGGAGGHRGVTRGGRGDRRGEG